MKWYMCISSTSLDRHLHGWRSLIRGALASARRNTSLKPHIIYDGPKDELSEEWTKLGATVIHHRVSVYEAIAERAKTEPSYLPIASGAFLRIDIPLIEQEEDYVLYTDVDVIFLREPELDRLKPRYFCAAPQTNPSDYDNDLNSGVLLLNVKSMRETHEEFKSFIVRHLKDGWPGCDQENYRRFYKGKHEKLPLHYNWKPYWGSNPDVCILHWHGPKPDAVEKLILGERNGLYNPWISLYERNAEGYRLAIETTKMFYSNNTPEITSSSTLTKSENSIHGSIDRVSESGIAGWAIDRSASNTPVHLEFQNKNGERVKVSCSAYRSDLKRIFGSDVGGFSISFPSGFVASGDFLTALDSAGNPATLSFFGEHVSKFTLPDPNFIKLPSSPSMPASAVKHLQEVTSSSKVYLEYGAGGSTVMLANTTEAQLVSVESDLNWLSALKTQLLNRADKARFHFLHGDIGETRELGFPKSRENIENWHKYALSPWEYMAARGLQPNVVLIDGRFRRACFLATLLHAPAGTRILFDDYEDRPFYHSVEKFVAPHEKHDRMASFFRPLEVDSRRIWHELFSAVMDPR